MSLLRSGLVVGLASVASRILGFVRDILIAAALGAGPLADAFLIAYRLPNLVRRVLGEGGLNAGFVPLHARLRAEAGNEAARDFAARSLAGCAVVALVLVGLVELAAGAVVAWLAAGYAGDPAVLDLATTLTRLAFPFVAGALLASLYGAILNADRRFTAAALAPAVVNLFLIAILVLLPWLGLAPETGARVLAGAVAASGFLHLALVAAPAIRAGIPWARPRLDAPTRRLLVVGLPALAASGAAQLVLLAAAQVASFTPAAVSWLYYADRLYQLPLGFIGIGVGVVLLPEIAGRAGTAGEATGRALEATLLVALPAAAALGFLAGDMTPVLFQRGAFGPQDSDGTALVLMGLAPSLPFAAAGKVLAQALFAAERMRAALVATVTGIGVTVLAGLAAGGAPGALGIGLAASAGLAAHALVLAAVLTAAGTWRPDRRLGSATIRAVLACLGMVAVLWLVRTWMGSVPEGVAGAIPLGLLCVAGLLAYALLALGLGLVRLEDLRGGRRRA